MRSTVAIVTGGSSGIGLAAARALRDKGLSVYILSRHPFSEKGLHHLCADVADERQCAEAVLTVLRKEGDLDLLVNCAGFGISGAVEFTELADAKKQMEVNFFGCVNMTKAALSYMRERGNGHIVNISSVAAPAAIPFQAIATPAGADCVRVGREEPPQLGLHLRPIRFFSCRCRASFVQKTW